MENIGIYLFALIVVVWPALSYLFAANLTTSQWASLDDHSYTPVARNTPAQHHQPVSHRCADAKLCEVADRHAICGCPSS